MTTRPPAHTTGLAQAVALALAILPAGAWAMDLVQAYQAAASIDPVVASARAQLEATRERVPQARAGLLPTVNANLAASRQAVDSSLRDDRYFVNPKNYVLQLTQPLFRLQNLEAYAQSKLSVAVGEAQLAQVRQDLMLRVSQAYFDVLGSQDNLQTIRAQIRAISEQLASAKRNFEVGTATITDQQEAQARYDLATAQELAAQNDLEVRRAALAQLVGKPVPMLKPLRSGVALQPPQPARVSEWTDGARSDNPSVQQARLAAEIAAREVDRQRYGHYPTLDLVSSMGRQASSTPQGIGFTSSAATVGVQFSMPIFAGGGIDARVRESANLRDKALSDLETARRSAEQAARTAFLGVNSGLAQVGALEAAEKSSRLALDSNLLGYQVGVRINIDVLNAQQQLFTTQRDLARARYDVLVNGLKLKSTAGALSEADLASVASLLDVSSPAQPTQGGPSR
jgi:outer membrane protein